MFTSFIYNIALGIHWIHYLFILNEKSIKVISIYQITQLFSNILLLNYSSLQQYSIVRLIENYNLWLFVWAWQRSTMPKHLEHHLMFVWYRSLFFSSINYNLPLSHHTNYSIHSAAYSPCNFSLKFVSNTHFGNLSYLILLTLSLSNQLTSLFASNIYFGNLSYLLQLTAIFLTTQFSNVSLLTFILFDGLLSSNFYLLKSSSSNILKNNNNHYQIILQ